MHGLIFETSICYWQDQPDIYPTLERWKHETRRFRNSARLNPQIFLSPLVSFTQRRQRTSFQPVGIRFATANFGTVFLARRSKPARTRYSFRVYFPAEARKPLSLLQWSAWSGRTNSALPLLDSCVHWESRPPVYNSVHNGSSRPVRHSTRRFGANSTRPRHLGFRLSLDKGTFIETHTKSTEIMLITIKFRFSLT